MNGTATMHTTIGGLAADSVGRPDHRPALVLLHGLTFDRRMWRPTLAELDTLDPGRRAIAVDLPGHGESPDAAAYDLAATVEQVHQVILDAGLIDPVLVGHSASAAVVAVYAAPVSDPRDHRGRGHGVGRPLRRASSGRSSLSFAATASRPHGRSVSTPVFGLDDVSDDVRAFVEDASRPRPEVVISSWSDLLTRSTDELEALIAGAAQAIEAAGIPVTALFGRQPSPAEVAWYSANLPDARTLVWPGSGHFPHLAYPRAVRRAPRVNRSTCCPGSGVARAYAPDPPERGRPDPRPARRPAPPRSSLRRPRGSPPS